MFHLLVSIGLKNILLGGLGKIKLAEAYLEQGKTEKVKELIKDG